MKTCSPSFSSDADLILSEEQVEWADLILVMEKIHRERLNQKFPNALRSKRIVVLGIPDDYAYMAPLLIQLLKKRCAQYLR